MTHLEVTNCTVLIAILVVVASPFIGAPKGVEFQCSNCGRADLAVLDFSNDQVYWSLKVNVQGDLRNKATLAIKTGENVWLNLYNRNWFYDSTTNSTTFYDSRTTP